MNGRRGVLVAVAAGALAVWATTALGFWQLRRADAKEALQQRIAASASAAPTTPDAASLDQPASLVDRHLRLHGRWLPDHVVYLDNRPHAGQPGFYVLMTLRMDDPIAADIVVNRGWLPRDATDRTRIAPYRTPDGAVDVVGVASSGEPRFLELAKPSDRPLGGIWQNFDFEAFGRASGRAPLPVVVRQDAGAPDDGLARDWPDRGGDLQAQIDRHHGYAFQWFALAATFLALAVFRIVRIARHVRLDPH